MPKCDIQSHRHPESTWQNGCLRPPGFFTTLFNSCPIYRTGLSIFIKISSLNANFSHTFPIIRSCSIFADSVFNAVLIPV